MADIPDRQPAQHEYSLSLVPHDPYQFRVDFHTTIRPERMEMIKWEIEGFASAGVTYEGNALITTFHTDSYNPWELMHWAIAKAWSYPIPVRAFRQFVLTDTHKSVWRAELTFDVPAHEQGRIARRLRTGTSSKQVYFGGPRTIMIRPRNTYQHSPFHNVFEDEAPYTREKMIVSVLEELTGSYCPTREHRFFP